jgi:hypothetical protein
MMALPRRVVVRWTAVIAAVGALAAVPAIARARPAPARDQESAATVVSRIRDAKALSYSGYAESDGTLSVPDVAQLGDLPSLLGDVTKMRVWSGAGTGSRVDVIDDLGETDTYTADSQPGTLVWNSQERRVTIVRGAPPIRAPRAGDLLPSTLGERLAGATTGATVTRIGSHLVAGRTAQGIRIHPSGESTIDDVDIWADTKTGVPLQVQITPVGASRPALSTAFLSFGTGTPATSTITFKAPPDAKVQSTNATNLQGLLGRLRGFPYPPSLVGLADTQAVSGFPTVATYGNALQTIAVARLEPDDADRFAKAIALSATTITDIANAQAQSVSTPLVNALLVRSGRRDFLLAGTVSVATLRTAYGQLAAVQFFRGPPPQGPPSSPTPTTNTEAS